MRVSSPFRPLVLAGSAALASGIAACSATGDDGPPPGTLPVPRQPEGEAPDESSDPDPPMGESPRGNGESGPDFGLMEPEEGDLDGCNELAVQFEKIIPTVAVVVDRSGSMFTNQGRVTRTELWDPLFQALTDPDTGVIPALHEDVRFGFTAYNRDEALGAAACPNLVSVPIALDNAQAIAETYAQAGVEPTNYYKWETPTAESVAAVAAELAAFAEPGPKYLLLVTDGNPDRCSQPDPQCGQDDAIAAVQEAYALGITTFAVGIGDIATSVNDPGVTGCWGRCGALHLQDLANAGAGQPVLRNTDQGFLDTCFNDRRDQNGVQQYVAQYVDDPALAGNAEFFAPEDASQLRDTLGAILSGVRSCTFSLTEEVRAGSESTGTVRLDGEDLVYGDPDGWTMLSSTDVELTGAACQRLQNEVRSVDISFPCESYIR